MLCLFTFKNSPINTSASLYFCCKLAVVKCWNTVGHTFALSLCVINRSVVPSKWARLQKTWLLYFLFPCGIAKINGLHDYSWFEEYSCSMRSVDEVMKSVLYQTFMCHPCLFIKSLFYTVICKFTTFIKQLLFQNLGWEISKYAQWISAFKYRKVTKKVIVNSITLKL